VAVQGASAVHEVSEALQELDAEASVDVIVVARGGGAFEDLLVFSDESLLRLVAALDTPVVSAIGHEEDSPLLDLVADVRASTPTDAARQIVPDLASELDALDSLRDRSARVVSELIERAELEVESLFERGAKALTSLVTREYEWLSGARGQVRALSPLATLARGYAVIQNQVGEVINSVQQVSPGQDLVARLSDGPINIVVK
jgi:exodeoxyribonuclease VII large subunit